MHSKTIHRAHLGKRTLAYLIDFAFTALLMVILFATLGQNVIMPAYHYREYCDLEFSFRVDGGLITTTYTPDGHIDTPSLLSFAPIYQDQETGLECFGYEDYAEVIFNYYVNFLPNVKEYDERYYVDNVGDLTPEMYYTPSYVRDTIYNIDENRYFSDMDMLTGELTLTIEAEALLSDPSTKNEGAALLRSYFANDSTETGIYYNACYHAMNQSYYTNVRNRISRAIYMAEVPSIVISPFIFFFLIPVFIPNGKSLGKLITSIAIISNDEFKAKKLQIIIHQAWLTIFYGFLLLPNQLLGFMLLILVYVVDYMILAMSKKNASLHDLIASTYVINDKDSMFFVDFEAKKQYAKENPSSLVAIEVGDKKETLVAPTISEEERIRMDSILDLSTINARREEARKMTSFDDFENGITKEDEEK